MKFLPSTIKFHLKRIAILSVLFLGLFFGSFYLVNLNLDYFKKPSVVTKPVQNINLDDELRKRIGSTELALADGSTLSYTAWAKIYGLNDSNNGLDADPDSSGLPNYLKYVYLTNPLNPDPNQKGFTDAQDVAGGFDPTAPKGARPRVEISIDKMGVNAPVVWSTSTDDTKMLKDLENGVSHFAGTAAPGQEGNMIISGHSSNYVWAKGNYNHIFENLNDLQSGDVVNIKMTEQNGRIITFHYKVADKYVTTADDQRVFEDTTSPTLTLSTCWPIGTSLKRLIVKSELIM